MSARWQQFPPASEHNPRDAQALQPFGDTISKHHKDPATSLRHGVGFAPAKRPNWLQKRANPSPRTRSRYNRRFLAKPRRSTRRRVAPVSATLAIDHVRTVHGQYLRWFGA